eukprot:TRINITY_DN52660_c0_g1_i1.p1 TRINITY_DN52660_c0_g1~~TRINITY_DN52660_c0_g1_i1.p1  ORF type:complete len:108 (+),score=39.11 TRINITY_DN52660_c0_g1_i1:3-326(+)
MKIDEPPTPFNYYDPAQDKDLEEPGISPRSVGSDEDEEDVTDKQREMEQAIAARFAEAPEDQDERRQEASKSNFAAQRKAHYNEFTAAKMLGRTQEEEEDDEEEEEE